MNIKRLCCVISALLLLMSIPVSVLAQETGDAPEQPKYQPGEAIVCVTHSAAQSMADEGASASEFSLVDPSQTDRVTLHVKLGSRRYRMNEETGEVESSVEYEDENLDWERFEDAWVPVPLSHPEDPEEEGWAYGMRNLREEIEDISPADVGQLTMGLTMFRMVIPMIEQCETTKDLERVFRNMR